jgi:hypothetical protein
MTGIQRTLWLLACCVCVATFVLSSYWGPQWIK